jgi:DNA-binding GntR family transcriptional regulator
MRPNLYIIDKSRSLVGLSKEETAYLEIKRNIIAAKFASGQKIIFRDLEEALGMSKTPITSALARLEQEGFLYSEHNRGYYVKKLTKDEIRQLYQLRIHLEGIAVEFAAAHHTQDDLRTLRGLLEDYITNDCNYYDVRRLEQDIDFHLQIAKMGKNQFLVEIIMQIYERTLIGLTPVFMSPMIERFKKEHSLVVQAIEERDAKRAKEVISAHESITLDILDAQ